MNLKKYAALALGCLSVQAALAKERPSQLPLLVIGGSYSEGKSPFNNGIAPLGGISVGSGSYLSFGHALTRSNPTDATTRKAARLIGRELMQRDARH